MVSDPVDTASFADVTVQTSQGSCDTTVLCSLGTLAANGTATITVTATVTARDTTLTNLARVSSSTFDPDTFDKIGVATITVPATADLAIAKTGTANPNQGGADSYTLTVSNNGPDSAHNVVVNDTLPSQFTATSASGPGFTCTVPTGPGGTVVCTDPLLTTASSPVQITINGTVAPATAGQTIADAATVSSDSGTDPDLSNNTATFSQLIGPAADLTITKQAFLSDGVTPVTNPLAVGDTFIYTITVANNGPSPASSVVASDTLPAGLSLVSFSPPPGVTCVTGGGKGTCNLGTVNPGSRVTFQLVVRVDPFAANTAIANTATVSSPTPDPNPTGTQSSTSTVGVGDVANLALSKSVSPQSANVGDTVTYTLTATNTIPIGEAGGAPAAWERRAA
jgi:uncharacterized repeat protein (TIGR01451 family)